MVVLVIIVPTPWTVLNAVNDIGLGIGEVDSLDKTSTIGYNMVEKNPSDSGKSPMGQGPFLLGLEQCPTWRGRCQAQGSRERGFCYGKVQQNNRRGK